MFAAASAGFLKFLHGRPDLRGGLDARTLTTPRSIDLPSASFQPLKETSLASLDMAKRMRASHSIRNSSDQVLSGGPMNGARAVLSFWKERYNCSVGESHAALLLRRLRW